MVTCYCQGPFLSTGLLGLETAVTDALRYHLYEYSQTHTNSVVAGYCLKYIGRVSRLFVIEFLSFSLAKSNSHFLSSPLSDAVQSLPHFSRTEIIRLFYYKFSAGDTWLQHMETSFGFP